MVYTKPLSGRGDAVAAAVQQQGGRIKRGVPISSSGQQFASLMPAGGGLLPNGLSPMTPVSKNGQPMSPEDRVMQGAMGMTQTKAMATLAKVMENSASPLKTLNATNVNERLAKMIQTRPERPRRVDNSALLSSAETNVRVAAHKKKDKPMERLAEMLEKKVATIKQHIPALAGKTAAESTPEGIGALTAKFESGNEGSSAIGYDRHGGTSYGKFQLSSRAGTMRNFIDFLKTEEPEWATRLEKAGPTNTGGKSGRMPSVWKELAEEKPERFEDLQDRFIVASHFQPAIDAIAQKTGVAFDSMPQALQEVVFSTAVQHGPSGAARIVSRAVGYVGQAKLDPEKALPEQLSKAGESLIRRIYDIRSDQFGSSTSRVQSAVKSRLKQEMSMAISMLREGGVAAT